MAEERRSGGSNVPISGKIGKAAPTAKSGASSAPDTGPVEDDRMEDTGMDEEDLHEK